MSRLRLCLLLTFLFLLVPNVASAQDTYSSLPPSSVSPFKAGDWTFNISSTNNSQSDWQELNENQVFYQRLTHSQTDKNWEIKIGKGGQFFSIKTPKVGEMIPRQRHSDWVDEVFQHVIPSYFHNTKDGNAVDGDIHQAGYYRISDIDRTQLIPHSIYSPLFNNILTQLSPSSIPSSISYITWPQHAHLPRTYTDNGMLMHQNVRDLGDGVVEITLLITKWSGLETRSINVPFSAFRPENIPTQIISLPNGEYITKNQSFEVSQGGGPVWLRDNSTGGWMAMTSGDTLNSHGIGIVYGKTLSPLEGNGSYVRWGQYGAQSDEEAGIVATAKRDITLLSGDSYFFRYYLVLGSLRDIQKYGNLLAEQVQIGKIETPLSQASAVSICTHDTKMLRRGCPDGQVPLFYSYRDFVRGAYPLFLLKNTSNNRYILTSDPYKISDNPTDGKTEYIDFLGWAMPDNLVTDKSQTQYLKSILTDRSLYPINNPPQETLMVKSTSGTGSTIKDGDFNADGSVNLLDYNLLVTNYGNPYTLLDYNLLVANFGK